ncbi:hypothetical protein [Desulfotignum phosphitoxidans]|uniref:hypothetical protein n=1 Tax=Desulfotignum phosphitoxidans TaxID=190898 RepID=UPI00034C57A2|nr:hypothetical protein [Desulfotignum phosphitoxidans]
MKIKRRKIGLSLLATMPYQRSADLRSVAAIIAKGICFGLVAVSFNAHQTSAADDAPPVSATRSLPLSVHESAAVSSSMETRPVMSHHPKRANFERELASDEARHVADWVVHSGDNLSMPFAIVDKKDARVFVFAADGRLRSAAPALLGLALGDDAVPGIGDRPLWTIRPEERTTTAGRFVAALDRNLRGKEILWVDYDGGISMHPVITTKPKERRLQRLATLTPLDNRISYGCINVPVKFFDNVVRPAFTGTNGIVYVLPETRMARDVFESYDVEEGHAPVDSGGTQTQGVSPEAAYE